MKYAITFLGFFGWCAVMAIAIEAMHFQSHDLKMVLALIAGMPAGLWAASRHI